MKTFFNTLLISFLTSSFALAHDPAPTDGAEVNYLDFPWKNWEEFPSNHPLVVHFVIVLLIFGALIYVANIYFRKKELAWTAFLLFLLGLAAAFVASYSLHPHTKGLTEEAARILSLHDFWAFTTIRFGSIGAVLMGVNLFVFQKKRLVLSLVGVVLLIAAYSVSMAGHYGAHLVHIEGVGPQGEYLDLHEH
jgi:predicted membrane channel-forming protein YqfA (hemolysin III family)